MRRYDSFRKDQRPTASWDMRLRRAIVGLGGLLFLGGCNGSQQGDTDAQKIVVLGSLTGVGQEIVEEALAPLTEATGIEIVYEGTDAFATVLPIRVEGGEPPDIALFPQPGLMADLARSGDMVPLTLDPAVLSEAYAADWVELGTVDGELYGIWMRADPKSLVWYSPSAFEQAGYVIPQSWEALIALSEQIVADGGTPWCLGMESGDASGWVGTDWIEDILLRTAGPGVYDQWVAHEIPFTAEPVQQALDQFGEIVRNADYVYGGTTGVISIPFGDSPTPLFADPPGCYLHRQASFIADFLPASVVPGEDVRVFLLPGETAEPPLLTGGLVFGLLKDTPAGRQVMDYLATVEPHGIWAARGYISPHQAVDLTVYPNELVRQQAEILQQATTIRFDGSDQMPAAVGTGTFWTGMLDYAAGEPAADVLADIEASWPAE
ncbi:MAG: ABC transporter substrate-binding protein [Cyanobacteria bacterium J06632_22]